jgi:hypothetical protein
VCLGDIEAFDEISHSAAPVRAFSSHRAVAENHLTIEHSSETSSHLVHGLFHCIGMSRHSRHSLSAAVFTYLQCSRPPVTQSPFINDMCDTWINTIQLYSKPDQVQYSHLQYTAHIHVMQMLDLRNAVSHSLMNALV